MNGKPVSVQNLMNSQQGGQQCGGGQQRCFPGGNRGGNSNGSSNVSTRECRAEVDLALRKPAKRLDVEAASSASEEFRKLEISKGYGISNQSFWLRRNTLNGNTLDRNKDQHFLLTRRKDDKGDDIAELVVYKPLDYETTPKYNLTIQAKNDLEPQLDETINVVVEVIDQNDEVPLFERSPVLSILEDEPARTIVGQVKAKDSDIDARFRTITYAIDPENGNGDWKHFDIDPKDRTIRSKSSFDREHKSKYTLDVERLQFGLGGL
ncbi:hypothetical protein RvY_19248 [Ramazzottius varieornatus]|uniref:Cadherin domain-containing protein n=1 Tax=Ramazzottius varieornatus TaxID=947166 RepID=A0A1D1W8R9_RAMVA|nr:hypothetical protein RvY_19248 [Ramazzottius varieornatus]